MLTFFENDSYGLAVGGESERNPWGSDIVINSFHFNELGFAETDPKALTLETIGKSTEELSVQYFVEGAFKKCIAPIRSKLIEHIELANNDAYLKKLFNYKLNIHILKARKFNYRHILKKEEPFEVNFYYAVDSCSEIEPAFLRALMLANHEMGHLYFIKKNIIGNYTLSENEYWATKIGLCSFLENSNVSYVRTYDKKLSKKQKEDYTNKRLSNSSYATQLGLIKAHSELFSLSKAEKITKANKNIKDIGQWCNNIP